MRRRINRTTKRPSITSKMLYDKYKEFGFNSKQANEKMKFKRLNSQMQFANG